MEENLKLRLQLAAQRNEMKAGQEDMKDDDRFTENGSEEELEGKMAARQEKMEMKIQAPDNKIDDETKITKIAIKDKTDKKLKEHKKNFQIPLNMDINSSVVSLTCAQDTIPF